MPNPQSPQSSDTVGSDRLRKAIERNRAKQAKRQGRSSAQASSESQGSLFDRGWKSPGKSSTSRSRSSGSSASSRRRGVALAGEEAEFDRDVRRSVNRAPARASYAPAAKKTSSTSVTRTRRTTRRTQKKTDSEFVRYLVIGAWMFCAFLFGRLIFSTGGILDYYQSQQLLDSKAREYDHTVSENKELVQEIELIKKDHGHQKRLVRKHLGFIDNDEFLILFPKDVKNSTI